MRKFLPVLLVTLALLTSACIKDLKKENIFTVTQCTGTLIEQRTNQPICGMRIQLTNGDLIPITEFSTLDGSFDIEVSAEEVSQKYYLKITADSLYDTKLVSLEQVGYGKKSFDLGRIYIIGPEVPVVKTNDISNVSAVAAHCGGEVTDGGKSYVSNRGFCWSTSQYPTIADSHTSNGSGLGVFEGDITGLSVGTVYYVRAYATNGVGTGYGEMKSFTTMSGLPVVSTNTMSYIQPTTAVCGGSVQDDGGFSVTARGVCWSTAMEPTISNAHTVNGAGLGNFISSMSGLQTNTTYYVRAYATNTNGTTYGEQRSFTTATGLPAVTTAVVSNISQGTAVCGGIVTADGGFSVTARGVCYSTTPGPSIASLHTTDGAGLGTFVSQLTGLNSGITYYVRAYATNGVGTVYGEERTFVWE